MKRAWVLGTLVWIAGCAEPPSVFPLREGWSGTYQVTGAFLPQVEDIKVVRRSTVAGEPGWVLGGALGESRLAWKDGVLVAEQLAGTWYAPPLPILRSTSGDEEWRGVAVTLGKAKAISGTLIQRDEKVEFADKKTPSTHVVLDLAEPGAKIEIQIWYAKGLGPIRWEHRRNTALVQKAVLMR
ncbi:MAG: hypothetical protein H3C58_14635 [Fimbriimonadaceae bacterium]|nr:hypothetical protein [Fimbriimonadaceae bacterium]